MGNALKSADRAGHNERKKQILMMLSKGQMTAEEVAREVEISGKTAQKLLLNYSRLGLVRRESKRGIGAGKGKYLYRLNEKGRMKLLILKTTPRAR